MYRTDFWTREKARVGCFKRTASKHVYYLGWNRSLAQVGCMRQVLGPGALGRPRGIRWRGRWEEGSGWGIHVTPWLILVNVWQKPLQYCKVISLQLIKKKKQWATNKYKNRFQVNFWNEMFYLMEPREKWFRSSLGNLTAGKFLAILFLDIILQFLVILNGHLSTCQIDCFILKYLNIVPRCEICFFLSCCSLSPSFGVQFGLKY